MVRSTNRWVVYSTFDPEGMLRQHAVEQIVAYRDAGSSVLVVDTSPTVSAERASAWDRHATAWFQRENEGYDFGSYKAGLQWIRERSPDGSYSLLLTNDSCYGPFSPINSILRRFDNNDGPPMVFGITDSYELGYHLQSYFLYFQSRTIPLLLDFLQNLNKISRSAECNRKWRDRIISVFARARRKTRGTLPCLRADRSPFRLSLAVARRINNQTTTQEI